MRVSIIIALLSIIYVQTASAQKVYSTDRQYQADVKVLIVYKTDKDYRAKKSENKGIWFFTTKEYQADKKVFFVDHEYQADLKVYFTDKEYRAGWKKNDKKPLMY